MNDDVKHAASQLLPAFTRMTGYAADEVIGRTPRFLEGPATSRCILDRLKACLAAKTPFYGEVTRLRSIAKGSEPRRETFIMNDVIAPALDALVLDIERDGVSLHAELECWSTVDVDSAQIRYVLVNLVQHASESIQSSAATTGNIKLRSWSHDGVCHVTVEDDGPGLEYEALADIFGPFCSTKTDKGLGLAFSKAIVKAHGGDIFAERVESRGLSVGFTIPAVQAPNHD